MSEDKNTKMYQAFQVTSFIDSNNLLTAFDGTQVTRNPRRGQWIKFAWMNRRSRFIGVTAAGAYCIDHNSGGNFKKFSERCKAFDRSYGRQLVFKFKK